MIPYIDYGLCEGCEACAELFPKLFVMRDDKAWVGDLKAFNPDDEANVIACCPFRAITVE